MKYSDEQLFTPIYLRMSEEMPWPEDEVFYMLTSSGLFLCRNNTYFRSCVPARSWPGELAPQKRFLNLRYPKIPRYLIEQAVGFFEAVGRKHDSEAALLLVWDDQREIYRLIVPKQRCTVYENWQGNRSPQGVHYDLPERVPRNWVIVGDIHSHVDFAAYASATDQYDELYRTGLHIVVGRIYDEPPEFHVEATVDGVRFNVQQNLVFEGYVSRRMTFPEEWFDWLKIEVSSAYTFSSSSSSWNNSYTSPSSGGYGSTAKVSAPGAWKSGTTGWTAIPAEASRCANDDRDGEEHAEVVPGREEGR